MHKATILREIIGDILLQAIWPGAIRVFVIAPQTLPAGPAVSGLFK
jgi:hypothetical protein